jgi:hypothetical protein
MKKLIALCALALSLFSCTPQSYICGGRLYTSNGSVLGNGDYVVRTLKESERISAFQDTAGMLLQKHGAGSKELRDFLSKYPDLVRKTE